MIRSLLAALALALGLATPAIAADDLTPYVGVDYQYVVPSFAKFISSSMPGGAQGGDVHVGLRVNQFVGAELGWSDTTAAKASNVNGLFSSSSITINGPTLDILGYLPLTDSLSAVGTIGAGFQCERAIFAASVGKNCGASLRGGGGIAWRPVDCFEFTGLVRYESQGVTLASSHAVVLSVGLNAFL